MERRIPRPIRWEITLRLVVGLCVVSALGLLVDAVAQSSSSPYVGQNKGMSGFSYGPGIRLRNEQTRGIKAGDFIIWPSLHLEGRWDSNVFHEATCGSPQDDPGCDESPVDAPVLRIVPGFSVTNTNPNKLAFEFGVESGVRLYLSERNDVSEQKNFDVKSDLRIDILPMGPVTVSIEDTFRRTLDSANYSTSETYNRNYNRGGARVSIHPGGGALNIQLGYGYVFNNFDDFDKGDSQAHEFEFLTTWRFYPKTVAFLSATGSLKDWSTDDESGLYVDNKPLRVTAGLNGYFTKKIAALIKVGYGNSYYESGPDFEHVIGQAELSYKISPTVLAAIGYKRDFTDSFFGNYYGDDSVYVRANMRLARRVSIELLSSFHLVQYSGFDPVELGQAVQVSNKERIDQVLDVHAQVSVDITRWIGLTAGYELRTVFSDFWTRYIDVSSGQDQFDYGRYVKHQVYGSIDIRY